MQFISSGFQQSELPSAALHADPSATGSNAFHKFYLEHYGLFPSLHVIACGEIDSKQIIKPKRSNLENMAEILDSLFEQGWTGKAKKQNKGCWTEGAESDEWTGPQRNY